MLNTPNLRHRLRQLLNAEDGIALIIAVIVVTIIGVAAASAAAIVTSSEKTASNERQGARALSGGEAGLDIASNAVLQSSWNGSASLPPDGTTFSGTQSVASGNSVDNVKNVDWSAKYSSASGKWLVQSRAVSPDGKTTRLLQEQLQGSYQPGASNPNPIWGYGFVMGGSPYSGPPLTPDQICALSTTNNLAGSSTVVAPVYVGGDVCISGGSNPTFGNPDAVASHQITAYIGGALYVTGVNYAIGTPAGSGFGQVKSALIVGGCWAQPHAGWTLLSGCDANQNLNANSSPTAGSGVQALDFHPAIPSPAPAKPSFEMADELAKYNSASPRPAQPCSNTGGQSPFTDSNNVPDTSLGTVDLLVTANSPGVNWSCQTPGGTLAWNRATKTFTITGDVFIDANVSFNSSSTVLYAGSGVLYVDGTIVFPAGGGYFCGATATALSTGSCDPNWDPTIHPSDPLIEFAAINHSLIQTAPPRSTTTTGFNISYPKGPSIFQGIAYANGSFDMGASGQLVGSAFADQAHLRGDGEFKAINLPPPGAIGGNTPSTVTVWSVSPHSWRECPPTAGCS